MATMARALVYILTIGACKLLQAMAKRFAPGVSGVQSAVLWGETAGLTALWLVQVRGVTGLMKCEYSAEKAGGRGAMMSRVITLGAL